MFLKDYVSKVNNTARNRIFIKKSYNSCHLIVTYSLCSNTDSGGKQFITYSYLFLSLILLVPPFPPFSVLHIYFP